MPGKRKVYNRQTSSAVERQMVAAAKQIEKEKQKAGGLQRNYQRLALDFTEHKIPKKAAVAIARRLQELNKARIAGTISLDDYYDDFYDDVYYPLYDEYDYDLEEDYGEEE